MKNYFYLLLVLLFANCKTTKPQFLVSSNVETYPATGVGCFDGDSPTIRFWPDTSQFYPDTTYRIRLYGIDAPERPSLYVTKRQPGSYEAAESLRKLVRGKSLRIIPIYTDMFDREVSRVYVGDTLDVSEYLIQNGHAWFRAEANMNPKEVVRLKELQAIAKRNKLGLWGQSGTKSNPATWRKKYSGWKQR